MQTKPFKLFLLLSFFSFNLALAELSTESRKFYIQLKADTENGLDSMRDPQSSLIADKAIWDEKTGKQRLDPLIASTNQALDLILLLNQNTEQSQRKVTQAIDALSKFRKFKVGASEFFYWGYKKTLAGKYQVANPEVSSIDNFHLAYAFWLTSKLSTNVETRKKSGQMFSKMKMDAFLDPVTGLVRTAFFKQPDGSHKLASHSYGYWGSETRSIYAVGSALNMFQSEPDIRSYAKKLRQSMHFECTRTPSVGNIIRTWDGGAFQFFLPELLYSESSFSPTMASSLKNYGQLLQNEKAIRKLPFAPALSACQTSESSDPRFSDSHDDYRGNVGLVKVMSGSNQERSELERDPREDVFTPHALALAATSNPEIFYQDLLAMKNVQALNGSLYQPLHGYMESYHNQGPHKGLMVPVQLSVNQGMIAQSVDQILASDQKTLAARTVMQDSQSKRNLQLFYSEIEPSLAATFSTSRRKSRGSFKRKLVAPFKDHAICSELFELQL